MKKFNESTTPVIDFLRCVYFSKGNYPERAKDLEQIEADLRLFSIGAPVYQKLKQTGRLDEIPAELRPVLKVSFESVLFRNLHLKRQSKDILKICERKGIAAIPFGGIAFAEQYHGHCAAGLASGIDILVHPSELKDAQEAIGASVRLHTGFIGKKTERRQVISFWREAKQMGHSMYLKNLSPVHTLYMACLNGMSGRMDSLGAVIDILAVLLKEGNQIEFGQLFKQARRDGMLRKVRFALSVVYGLFPELQEAKPCSQIWGRTCWNVSAIRKMAQRKSGPKVWLYKTRFWFSVSETWRKPLRALILFLWPSLKPGSPDRREGEKGLREARQH